VGGLEGLLENNTATERQPMHSHRLHLLCAEDNFVNRTVINLILEDMGHEVEFAEDGTKAVEALSRRRFDAVLMDNRMPVMDGFEATRIIRDRTSSVLDHDVYIIAATANSSREYEQEALRSGMNDWISKPVREDVLHAALQRAIEFQTQRGVAMVVSDKKPETSLPPAPAVDDFDFHGGISEEDLSALLKSVSSGPESSTPDNAPSDTLLDIPVDLAPPSARDYAATLSPEARKLVAREFLRDTPERLSTMKASLHDGDAEALGRSAHTIKSTSLYVNAPRLSELGLRMESLADAHDLGNVEPLLIEAESEFASVRTRLESELAATPQ
jgi:CheY-like chemotaxis protein/HPt (histidine-containing phosphotransfer) domain-containing protein